jgi:hypothetical protein
MILHVVSQVEIPHLAAEMPDLLDRGGHPSLGACQVQVYAKEDDMPAAYLHVQVDGFQEAACVTPVDHLPEQAVVHLQG